MNYNEFINKYVGKSIDYDGVAGVQCVDLIKLYLDKVYNIKLGSFGNAKDYFINYDKSLSFKNSFEKIVNTANFVPIQGDICVWGAGLGNKYGHVAIATGKGNTKLFYSYDLNWGSKEVKLVEHNYKGFLGVLRYKGSGDEEMKTYKNGSTKEEVFADSECTIKIGELDKYEECQSYGIVNNKAIVLYDVNNTNNKKIGFVKYIGGIKE